MVTGTSRRQGLPLEEGTTTWTFDESLPDKEDGGVSMFGHYIKLFKYFITVYPVYLIV